MKLSNDSKNHSASRRLFLRSSLLVSTAGLSVPAHALPPKEVDGVPEETERKLRLVNENTRERLDVVYWKDGDYIDDHVGQLNYFMRDHHVNKSKLMDKRLYDNLYRLYSVLNTNRRIHVLSGYRTTATNETLRKSSKLVAKRSYHIKGRAVDIYIPGVDNLIIQSEARRLKLGGVGYYTKARFVHLDTGFPRHWVIS